MLKLKLFLLSTLIFFSAHASAIGLNDFIGEEKSSSNSYSVLGVTQDYYHLSNQISSKRLELEILQLPAKETNDSIEAIKDEIQTLETLKSELGDALEKLRVLESSEPDTETETLTQSIQKTQEDIEKTSILIEEQKVLLDEEIAKLSVTESERKTKAQALVQEIESLETGLETSQLRLENYIKSLVKKILLALSIWIFAIALKWIVSKIFSKIDLNMTPQRKAFIEQLIKIFINTSAIIAILIVFFSQLIGALPYFAIFATVITLALKDVILSVIAWIIIGTKDGYKVGHYLHIDSLWGTVVEINPFNTIVRQGGISGPTGRLLTFPNKKIFEEFLENWSKWYNFTYLKWDFYLEQDSDFDKAEKILLEVMSEARKSFADKIAQKKNQLLKLGIDDHDLEPLTFWEIQANGVLLRGKMLVDFNDFFVIRSEITKNFIEAIQKEDDITLRFVNNLIPNEL